MRIQSRSEDFETRIRSILVTRDGLAQGKREDIKHLFDAACEFEIFKTLEDLNAGNTQRLFVDNEHENWIQFERVLDNLDMSETEFNLEVERQCEREAS